MSASHQLYLKCEYCKDFFEYNGGKRRRWCTDAHRVAAWRLDRPVVDLGVLGKVRGINGIITSVEPVVLESSVKNVE